MTSSKLLFFFFLFSISLISQNNIKEVNMHSMLDEFYKTRPAGNIKTLTQTKHVNASWNFNEGDIKYWFTENFITKSYDSLKTVCRKVGENCYIFVEDSLWNNTVFQSEVDSYCEAFDNNTPANPGKGIYEKVVETFGEVPDVDNDPKIIILLLHIRVNHIDCSPPRGFYSSYNETNGEFSNRAEIIYIEGYHGKNSDLFCIPGTMAHEFQHVIFCHNSSSSLFFNEGCSVLAAYLSGGMDYMLETDFFFSPEYPLLNFDYDYSYQRAFKLMLYLKEQFGNSLLKKFVSSQYVDIEALDKDVLPSLGSGRRFKDIFNDWIVANYINNLDADSSWGYDDVNVRQVSSKVINNPNLNSQEAKIYKLSSTYVTFSRGKNIRVNINTNGSESIKAKVMKTSLAKTEVIDIPVNQDYLLGDLGTDYTQATLVIYNDYANDTEDPMTFYYSSSGTCTNEPVEIAYDKLAKTWCPLGNRDTVAVVFDSYPGARIDSIRIAVYNNAPVIAGIWEFVPRFGCLGVSPKGKKIADLFNVISDYTGSYGIVTPWKNWASADLRSYNLCADKSFIVAVTSEGPFNWDGTGGNAVMLCMEENPTTKLGDYTYTYFENAWHSTWYSQAAMIRAYVSYPSGDDTSSVPVELISFNAVVSGNDITLTWNTATELNNNGFEILKKQGDNEYAYAGFVKGKGTHSEESVYKFKDEKLLPGRYLYRLKQVDFDGTFKLSEEIEVIINIPEVYSLNQNYPNPFNPSTTFTFTIAKTGIVTLKIYDVLGREVSTIVNEEKAPGNYKVDFDATGLASGIYFYELRAGSFVQSRKMLLLR